MTALFSLLTPAPEPFKKQYAIIDTVFRKRKKYIAKVESKHNISVILLSCVRGGWVARKGLYVWEGKWDLQSTFQANGTPINHSEPRFSKRHLLLLVLRFCKSPIVETQAYVANE